MAFLHLSLGRQKATSGTFSMDGFESCWGFPVSDACGTVPLGAPKFNPSEAEAESMAVHRLVFLGFFLQFRRCLSGDVILTISTLPVR